MTDLSVIIPSRNELFLKRTIEDILANIRGDSEVIAVLDGAWAEPQIPDMPRVTLVHFTESIGQRAAVNRAARISEAKYIAKCDAHCAFDEGFDVKLMADMQDDITMVPIMRNLHIFDWVCEDGHRRYQGPSGPCMAPKKGYEDRNDLADPQEICGKPTKMDIVWISKRNPQSKAYRFDTSLHFQYWKEFEKRPEGKGDLTETLSLQGSFFMMTRKRYLELNICDESWGSWGNQGSEVAIKSWLAGGRVMVNHKTFYSHLFRTAGGDFSFPWPCSGRQVEHARKCSRDIFLNNKYEKQIYPLSWLIEKFKPIPDWHEESGRKILEQVTKAGIAFTSKSINSISVPSAVSNTPDTVIRSPANLTDSLPIMGSREQMPILAMGLPSLPGRGSLTSKDILLEGDKSQMTGITTDLISTNVVKDEAVSSLAFGDRAKIQSIHDPVCAVDSIIDTNFTISTIGGADPIPASSIGINFDASEKSLDLLVSKGEVIIGGSHSMPPIQVSSRLESERSSNRSDSLIIPQKGIVWYSDNRLDTKIMRACQEQLKRSADGNKIISVTLQPTEFGENITLSLERGYQTMFRQILTGLEASTADIVFFAEHDILYAPEYFSFTPPDRAKVYYNLNVWQVRTADGHAVYYDAKRTSQLCAYRDILVEHYRKRIERVEKDGFTRRIGFEPGSHHRPERIDDLQSDVWVAKYPNLDLKHGQNLTPTRWSTSEFRSQRNCRNWKEADEIPYWGVTGGRFEEILNSINGGLT